MALHQALRALSPLAHVRLLPTAAPVRQVHAQVKLVLVERVPPVRPAQSRPYKRVQVLDRTAPAAKPAVRVARLPLAAARQVLRVVRPAQHPVQR